MWASLSRLAALPPETVLDRAVAQPDAAPADEERRFAGCGELLAQRGDFGLVWIGHGEIGRERMRIL